MGVIDMNDTYIKPIPVLYQKKEDCCGCTACYAVCAQHAIKMIEDEEGFLYPHIDVKLCICCNMCIKVCPVKES